MTALLEAAFAAAAQLPASEQDALARSLLADIESESKIDDAIGNNPAALARLADEAVEEHRKGLTEHLDTTQL
jgi:hypothetical protein